MKNPFKQGHIQPGGPTADLVPVTFDVDLADVALAMWVEVGGTIQFVSAAGNTRTVTVPNFAMLPVGFVRVIAAGTTATGIHGFTSL